MHFLFTIFTIIGLTLGIIHGNNVPIKKTVKPVAIVIPQITPTINPCPTITRETNNNLPIAGSRNSLDVEKMVKIKDNKTGEIRWILPSQLSQYGLQPEKEPMIKITNTETGEVRMIPQSQLGQYNIVSGSHANNGNQNISKGVGSINALPCGVQPSVIPTYYPTREHTISAYNEPTSAPTPMPTNIPTPTPTPEGLQGQINCNPSYVGGYDCTDNHGNQTTLNHNYGGGLEGHDNHGNQINLEPNYIGGYEGTYNNKQLDCQRNYTKGYDCRQ